MPLAQLVTVSQQLKDPGNRLLCSCYLFFLQEEEQQAGRNGLSVHVQGVESEASQHPASVGHNFDSFQFQKRMSIQ